MPLEKIQIDLPVIVTQRGIEWVEGAVTQIDPIAQRIWVTDNTMISYDYAVIAKFQPESRNA